LPDQRLPRPCRTRVTQGPRGAHTDVCSRDHGGSRKMMSFSQKTPAGRDPSLSVSGLCGNSCGTGGFQQPVGAAFTLPVGALSKPSLLRPQPCKPYPSNSSRAAATLAVLAGHEICGLLISIAHFVPVKHLQTLLGNPFLRPFSPAAEGGQTTAYQRHNLSFANLRVLPSHTSVSKTFVLLQTLPSTGHDISCP